MEGLRTATAALVGELGWSVSILMRTLGQSSGAPAISHVLRSRISLLGLLRADSLHVPANATTPVLYAMRAPAVRTLTPSIRLHCIRCRGTREAMLSRARPVRSAPRVRPGRGVRRTPALTALICLGACSCDSPLCCSPSTVA